MQKREALGERVAAGYVGEFVGEDGVEFGGVPVTPVGGEENGRAERAHRHGDGNEFRFGEAGSGGTSEFSRYERVVNGL